MTQRLRSTLRHLLGKDDAKPQPANPLSDPTRSDKEAGRLAKEAQRAARRERHREQAAALSVDAATMSVVTLDYEKHEVKLVATSDMEREWRAHSCAKEPWTVAWLEQSLAGGGVLYDIGANVGAFSLIGAKICGAHGTVVAFEPGYASFARLCDNIVLNRCQDVVIPVPLALGQKTGLATFTYKTLHPGQSRHEFDERAWKRESAAHGQRYHQPVLSMTLDEVVRNFDLPLPNHVKLDVDGAELSVLRGAAATLASPGLRSILIEIDETLTDPATALLTHYGFALAQKNKRVHDEHTQVWYGVFQRS